MFVVFHNSIDGRRYSSIRLANVPHYLQGVEYTPLVSKGVRVFSNLKYE